MYYKMTAVFFNYSKAISLLFGIMGHIILRKEYVIYKYMNLKLYFNANVTHSNFENNKFSLITH